MPIACRTSCARLGSGWKEAEWKLAGRVRQRFVTADLFLAWPHPATPPIPRECHPQRIRDPQLSCPCAAWHPVSSGLYRTMREVQQPPLLHIPRAKDEDDHRYRRLVGGDRDALGHA